MTDKKNPDSEILTIQNPERHVKLQDVTDPLERIWPLLILTAGSGLLFAICLIIFLDSIGVIK